MNPEVIRELARLHPILGGDYTEELSSLSTEELTAVEKVIKTIRENKEEIYTWANRLGTIVSVGSKLDKVGLSTVAAISSAATPYMGILGIVIDSLKAVHALDAAAKTSQIKGLLDKQLGDLERLVIDHANELGSYGSDNLGVIDAARGGIAPRIKEILNADKASITGWARNAIKHKLEHWTDAEIAALIGKLETTVGVNPDAPAPVKVVALVSPEPTPEEGAAYCARRLSVLLKRRMEDKSKEDRASGQIERIARADSYFLLMDKVVQYASLKRVSEINKEQAEAELVRMVGAMVGTAAGMVSLGAVISATMGAGAVTAIPYVLGSAAAGRMIAETFFTVSSRHRSPQDERAAARDDVAEVSLDISGGMGTVLLESQQKIDEKLLAVSRRMRMMQEKYFSHSPVRADVAPVLQAIENLSKKLLQRVYNRLFEEISIMQQAMFSNPMKAVGIIDNLDMLGHELDKIESQLEKARKDYGAEELPAGGLEPGIPAGLELVGMDARVEADKESINRAVGELPLLKSFDDTFFPPGYKSKERRALREDQEISLEDLRDALLNQHKQDLALVPTYHERKRMGSVVKQFKGFFSMRRSELTGKELDFLLKASQDLAPARNMRDVLRLKYCLTKWRNTLDQYSGQEHQIDAPLETKRMKYLRLAQGLPEKGSMRLRLPAAAAPTDLSTALESHELFPRAPKALPPGDAAAGVQPSSPGRARTGTVAGTSPFSPSPGEPVGTIPKVTPSSPRARTGTVAGASPFSPSPGEPVDTTLLATGLFGHTHAWTGGFKALPPDIAGTPMGDGYYARMAAAILATEPPKPSYPRSWLLVPGSSPGTSPGIRA